MHAFHLIGLVAVVGGWAGIKFDPFFFKFSGPNNHRNDMHISIVANLFYFCHIGRRVSYGRGGGIRGDEPKKTQINKVPNYWYYGKFSAIYLNYECPKTPSMREHPYSWRTQGANYKGVPATTSGTYT